MCIFPKTKLDGKNKKKYLMQMYQALNSFRFLPFLTVALMLLGLSLWSIVSFYSEPVDDYGMHSHDGETVHSHTAETCNAETPSKLTVENNEKKMLLPDNYLFVIHDNPIFSIERPPESILL